MAWGSEMPVRNECLPGDPEHGSEPPTLQERLERLGLLLLLGAVTVLWLCLLMWLLRWLLTWLLSTLSID